MYITHKPIYALTHTSTHPALRRTRLTSNGPVPSQVLCNVDELFERDELSAAPDPGWPDCFNSGVFVFRPSLHTHASLLDHTLQHGSFDGKTALHVWVLDSLGIKRRGERRVCPLLIISSLSLCTHKLYEYCRIILQSCLCEGVFLSA